MKQASMQIIIIKLSYSLTKVEGAIDLCLKLDICVLVSYRQDCLKITGHKATHVTLKSRN